MKPGGWMIPTLPIVSIAVASTIVFGGLWLWKHWIEISPDAGRRLGKQIDAAFDKVVSENDWIASGFPSEHSAFHPISFGDDAPSYMSERSLGSWKRGMIHASLTLTIDTPAHAAEERAAVAAGRGEEHVKIAEGFEKGQDDPARSWQLYAKRRIGSDGYEDLRGHLFHDGVTIEVRSRGVATQGQAGSFKRLIEASQERLAAVCANELLLHIRHVLDRATVR